MNVRWFSKHRKMFISHFDGLSNPPTAEFRLLKIPELSYKLHYTMWTSWCVMDLPHLPLLGLFSSRKCGILVVKLLVWQVWSTPICFRIASSLAWLINASWKAQPLCKMALHPILLDKWKISWAGHSVIIACWAPTFVMLGLPGLHTWIRVIIGYEVTWSRKSTAVDRHQYWC